MKHLVFVVFFFNEYVRIQNKGRYPNSCQVVTIQGSISERNNQEIDVLSLERNKNMF